MKRNFILSSYALLFLGPSFYIWYIKILPRVAPINFTLGKKIIGYQVSKKILLDETFMSGTFIISFLAWATYMETFCLIKVKEKIKKDALDLYLSDLLFWPFF